MTIAERFAKVAGAFSARVGQVSADEWERPSPCSGWVARDVVRHLVEWVPGFIASGADIELAPGPAVDHGPGGAWEHLQRELQAILDDPGRAGRTFSHPQVGTHRLDEAIDRFVLGDVLIHTWDLARAVGLDEGLDADEVHRMLAGIEPMGDALSKSGHYGPPVAVSPGADEQTRLLAFTGRRP